MKVSLRERIARRLFGDVIDQAVTAAISIRVDDSPGWDSLTQAGPADRPWHERHTDLDQALTAWRKNFLVRRITTLTRSYVLGDGITVTSKLPKVDQFLKVFWDHPKNLLDRRLAPMCDELTRTGEIFPVLFTNRVDGMSYIRFVIAAQIREIETEAQDYETELRYGQMQKTTTELKWWIGTGHKSAFKRARGGTGGKLLPLMLHFTVNRPLGATRGEGDLGPVLPWAKRYTAWLQDRVRLNRQRTRQGVLDVEIADDSLVQEKRKQLATSNPLEHGIYVHGRGEVVSMHSLQIRADDVKDDGHALRLAVAAGANTGLHFLGEGGSVNYATAKEMGEPTTRFYAERQRQIGWFLEDLVTAAYRRKVALDLAQMPPDDDLQLVTTTTEVARADNESLATAAKSIVFALREMKKQGWIDDTTAVRLAFKFAGEPLGEDEIKDILAGLSADKAGAETTGEPNDD